MPSSGDCEFAVERPLRNGEACQFDCEMAAPVLIENANWHRSLELPQECEWKQGDSAGCVGRAGMRLPLVGDAQSATPAPKTFLRRKHRRGAAASRWSAIHPLVGPTKLFLTGTGLLMEAANVSERS